MESNLLFMQEAKKILDTLLKLQSEITDSGLKSFVNDGCKIITKSMVLFGLTEVMSELLVEDGVDEKIIQQIMNLE